MKISENRHVTITYDLNVGEDDELELMEQATVESPMEFIFGVNQMLDAFEKQLKGLKQGDLFSFKLFSEEAYGEYDNDKMVELSKSIFEVSGKIDEELLFEGNIVPMMDSSGNRLIGSIVSIDNDLVTMDFNHPLAGENLYFSGKVLAVRDATPEEIEAVSLSEGCSGCQGGDCSGC